MYLQRLQKKQDRGFTNEAQICFCLSVIQSSNHFSCGIPGRCQPGKGAVTSPWYVWCTRATAVWGGCSSPKDTWSCAGRVGMVTSGSRGKSARLVGLVRCVSLLFVKHEQGHFWIFYIHASKYHAVISKTLCYSCPPFFPLKQSFLILLCALPCL